MAIDATRALTSAGVGVLDEAMEWWDEREERTETFRTARDISRLVVAGVGYGLQVFTRQARLGETLALSATPLLVKSVAKPVRGAFKSRARRETQVFVPRRRVEIPAKAPAPPSPAPMSRSYAPEARQVLAQ